MTRKRFDCVLLGALVLAAAVWVGYLAAAEDFTAAVLGFATLVLISIGLTLLLIGASEGVDA